VNPLGVVYLTNMGKYGAEHSLKAIYHARYGAGTKFSNNPPPGYVVGGPNQSVTGKAADGKPSIAWIKGQPRAKAYADFDIGWPESSWEMSEPAIYYQAIYLRLLAEFAR
jgi:endoglucanase